MDTSTVVLITLSSLSLLASGATLTLVWIGSKKVETQIEEVKTKSNKTVQALKTALDNLEL